MKRSPAINRPRASSGMAGMVMSSTPLPCSYLTGPWLCSAGCLQFHTWFLICEKANETRSLGFCMLYAAVKRLKTGSERGCGVTGRQRTSRACVAGYVWATEAGSGLSKWEMQGRNLSSAIKVSEYLL